MDANLEQALNPRKFPLFAVRGCAGSGKSTFAEKLKQAIERKSALVSGPYSEVKTFENDEFKTFAHDVAMQVVAADPAGATRESVPAEIVEHEKEIYRAQAAESGRPEKFWDGIVMGRLKKFFKERALTEQDFVKNPDITVGELAKQVSAKVGDDIEIVDFVRFQFGA